MGPAGVGGELSSQVPPRPGMHGDPGGHGPATDALGLTLHPADSPRPSGVPAQSRDLDTPHPGGGLACRELESPALRGLL